MSTKSYAMSLVATFVSTIAALALAIYSAAKEEYWIPVAMLAFGIAGIIVTAYARTRKRR